MILQCPACKTRYLTPDSSIGAKGRTVRCAKCKHTWFVEGVKTAPEALDEMLEQINVKPKPIPEGSNLPVKPAQNASIGLLAGVFGSAVVALTLLLIILFPALIGSPPSAKLVITDLKVNKPEVEAGAKPIYEISGKIYNTSEEAMASPVLRVTLVDKEGEALQYWDFSDSSKKLEPKESIPFTTGEIEVTFRLADRFVVELGSPLELSLRKKP